MAIVGWLIALITGRLTGGLHRFFCKYVNYTAHLFGYLLLVTNPYPEFVGDFGPLNALDIKLPDEPVVQPRWKTLVRLVIALPSLFVAAALGGAGGGATRGTARSSNSAGFQSSGVSSVTSFLGWCVCVVKGQMPKGFRDTGGFVVGYWAQILAYLLLVTDRYPNADPTAMLSSVERPPVHSVHVVGDSEDLRMSRVTVFFRLPLVIPLLFWLVLWSVLAVLASIVQWLVTLIRGRPIDSFHRFLSRWIRFGFHVYAFGALVANPFPSFGGQFGLYPLDLVLPRARPPEPVEDALPRAARDPGVPRQLRAQRRARGRRDPDLVRRACSPDRLPRGSGTCPSSRCGTRARRTRTRSS